jgi:hypothetical protein
MNVREGPGGAARFAPDELVPCDYVIVPKHGASRKFHCVLSDGHIVKVRYGLDNGHVQGSLLASRLLWALGFPADRVYPVRVLCRGCPADPWKNHELVAGVHEFDPAVIERKPPGHVMRDAERKSGWAWPELNRVDEQLGGAPRAQRDALVLLAVFMQHTDTKPRQQQLLCAPGGFDAAGQCAHPFMMIHDVGLTFGSANAFNRGEKGSVNLDEWAKTPIWKDPAACIGHLSKSHTGTLENPQVSEAGRKFLADLLEQLTDAQLRSLFEVARVDRRRAGDAPPPRIEDWIDTFKRKRDQIVTNRCAG